MNLIKILAVFFLPSLLVAQMYDYDIKPSYLKTSKFMNINILDSKELKFSNSSVSELSALAYENDTLYIVGDKGFLYNFKIKIKNQKIKKLSLKKVIKFKNKNLKRLKKEKRDSEGIALYKSNLLISFEKDPRVDLFSKNGQKIKNQKIPKQLRDIKNYKSKNKALEAVAYSKTYGVIIAPELPLKNKNKKYHTLYAKKKKWKILACGSLTSLEFMNKNELMILQREFNYLTRKRVITISKLNLKTNKYKVLAKLDSSKGWNIDNFEGVTKVGKKTYLMISDSNNSFLQKTLLVLFEVI